MKNHRRIKQPITDQHYRTPVYDIEINGQVVARVAKTGTHLDNYPWGWYLTVDTPEGWRGRNQGDCETLRDATDTIVSRWPE